jgi:hypothetical protein
MFNCSKLLLTLTLFWVPSGIAASSTQRIALITGCVAGAGYLYCTQDGRRTAAIIKIFVKKYSTKTSEAALEGKKWCIATINKHAATLNVPKEWLIKKLSQKTDHALMLETLTKLEKQTALLEQQNRVLTQQNALILNAVSKMETVLLPSNQSLKEKTIMLDEAFTLSPDFLTDDNEVNASSLTRSHKSIPEESDDDIFTRPGIIVMETDQK